MSQLSSVSVSATVRSIVVDNNHLFAVGGSGRLWKINKDLSGQIQQVSFPDSPLYALAQDATHLYAGGTRNTIYKISKTNINSYTQFELTSSIRGLAVDNDHIYAVTSDARIFKIKKDLSAQVWSMSYYSGTLYAVVNCDDSFIYVAGSATGNNDKVWKIDKESRNYTESPFLEGAIHSLSCR